uniref:B box-type domain-containing protein n=1 Tax=Macrostomum lignano TaxID=282301 RepID=A0A1I8F7I4_9PLAT
PRAAAGEVACLRGATWRGRRRLHTCRATVSTRTRARAASRPGRQSLDSWRRQNLRRRMQADARCLATAAGDLQLRAWRANSTKRLLWCSRQRECTAGRAAGFLASANNRILDKDPLLLEEESILMFLQWYQTAQGAPDQISRDKRDIKGHHYEGSDDEDGVDIADRENDNSVAFEDVPLNPWHTGHPPAVLIDSHYAFQNDILSGSIPSILGYKLRQMYLEQKRWRMPSTTCPPATILEHETESFRFYCRDCASKICTLCLVAHEGHDVISHAAAAVEEKFDNLWPRAVSQFGDIQVSLEKAMETATSRRRSSLRCRSCTIALTSCARPSVPGVDAAARPVLSEHDAALESWRTYKDMVRPQAEMRNDLAACLRLRKSVQAGGEDQDEAHRGQAEHSQPHPAWPGSPSASMERENPGFAVRPRKCLWNRPWTRSNAMVSFTARHVLDKAATCVEGLACCDNGNLVVSDSANLKVKVFGNDGRVVRCFVGGGHYQLAFPGDVVPVGGGCVATTKAVLFSENGMGRSLLPCHSCDCAFAGRDGEIGGTSTAPWNGCGCRAEGRLERSRPESVQLQHMGLMAKPRFGLLNPVSGCLFIVDPFEHCCFRDRAFMKKHGRQGHSFGEFNGPGAPACDPAGQVLVPDAANHRVHLLDACGSFVRYALTAADGLRAPRACCFDTGGHLWVAQQDGQLRQTVRADSYTYQDRRADSDTYQDRRADSYTYQDRRADSDTYQDRPARRLLHLSGQRRADSDTYQDRPRRTLTLPDRAVPDSPATPDSGTFGLQQSVGGVRRGPSNLAALRFCQKK